MSGRASFSARLGVLCAPLLFACTEQTVEVELHSLQASGDVAFVCRLTEDRKGYDRSLCPDFDGRGFKMFALVTQTSTEEVAVIDTVEAKVIDLDPSVPGYSFLRVPSRPGDIVSTPGGAATFVGIVGPGKEGITAIPTTCIGQPRPDETPRDVTSFPSCHLPSAPGDLAVLIAPPEGDGRIRVSCDAGSPYENEDESESEEPRECEALLPKEHLDPNEIEVGPRGRRKLAVALPESGEVVIIDGQWLLDQTPGSFPDCRVEARLPLRVELGPSEPEQYVPPELIVNPEVCTIEQPRPPPRPPSFGPSPAGFAPAGNLLYVADAEAPVIHVLDVSNPCVPSELPPLLPTSFAQPSRDVFTLKVAASPVTPDGKRYLYAIDRFDQPRTSLMAFDVSQGSTQRTPLVRPGSLRIPEPPDRLQLDAPVEDVAFALRDLETTDPETGVAESGVRCDPNPDTAPPGSPAAQHRPTSDETRGAQPRLLRGLFGLALLSTGHVAFIDVDDFDGPCRRPYTTNPVGDEDFRGCFGDVVPPEFLTLDGFATGSLTVTNEASCTVVSPHRFRSALFNRTNTTDGTGAPALAAFPEFSNTADTVEQPPQHLPKLLAVPFDGVNGGVPPEPQVYIGTTLHTKSSTSAALPTDPNTAELHSLTLPFFEPRSFPAAEAMTLVYEGPVTTQFPSGNVVFDPDDPNGQVMKIQDPAAQFCSRGVYSRAMLAEHGIEELGIELSEGDAFAERHADVVELTSDFLPSVDAYWVSPRLLDPESAGGCGLSYATCVDTFDNYDPTAVSANRELEVIEAFQDRLVVEPRGPEGDELEDEAKLELSRRLECCFPQGLEYRVRVQNQWVLIGSGGIRSDVTARREVLPYTEEVVFRCDRDCDPRKTYWNSRVFEIVAEPDCAASGCAVGAAQEGDACRYDPCDPDVLGRCQRDGSLRIDGSKDAAGIDNADRGALDCIHSGLTARFAIYRGLSPSVRGMTFSWQTLGGFRTLVTSLEAVSVAVLPQHVEYLPELQAIAIVDGAQLGLTLVSLDSLRVDDPWPVY